MRNQTVESFIFVFMWLAIMVLVALLSGCGVTVNHTHYYTILGTDNRISNTTRTDSRPDITTSTDTAVSGIPGL